MPYIDLSDVRCYFEQVGQGDPLLLIPGLGRTCRLWDGVAETLGEHFSLIMPDNRGLGRSIAKRTPRNLRDLAVDLVELLDGLGVERAHVLGISFGGVVAQWLAIDHPTRIKRLVRKTICFSKSIARHDIVIGLFVNGSEWRLPV